ncbi:unnamed protein product [Lactuca saligna]|uniref:Protein kinase domain-containing protein n=1 Tax=Lactuca saligna TaxID=75948 RepID=A0AA36EK11_LACSI|nr:unnamed protein product [Lactuca saligna]
MADSRVDVILEFLRRNNFARAEAALRSEIDNRPDLNGFMQGLNLGEKELLEKENIAKPVASGNRQRSSSTSDEVSKEEHIVKEIEFGTKRNGSDSKWEIASFEGDQNSEQIGARNKNFVFSNGSDDNLLDLYTWRFNPSNGYDDDDEDDNSIRTDTVKEYQVSSLSKIHPSEVASNTETGFSGDGKVSFLGPVITSKTNLVPKQQIMDKLVDPKGLNCQKDGFVDNPWSRNDEFNCSIKTVFPFSEGDASTSYGVGEKEDGKRKADNIRAAIKEQENEVGRALYFAKTQGSNETLGFGGSENQKEELPRLPPVKLKSTEKLSSMNWEEKHEHDDALGQILNADNAYLIGSFLDVPIGQELSSSGLKRPVGGSWRSISQGITEDTSDLVSGFATIGDGLSGSVDYPNPHEYWDSDEYDDDDDVGYMRQPIEDETWFLAHEIDYPSDNEKTTGQGTSPDPQERIIPNKNEDDDQSFAEEDSYLSGDQYPIITHSNVEYDGELMEEEELSLMSGEPVWQGFVSPTNELVMFGEGKVVDDGGSRSIGVGINNDVSETLVEGHIDNNHHLPLPLPLPPNRVKKETTKNVSEGGFSFPPPKNGQVASVSSQPSWSNSNNNKAIVGDDSDKSSREEEEEEDDGDVLNSAMPLDYGFGERGHIGKEEDEKVVDDSREEEEEEEDAGAILEDEEAVAVQEQVKQIKAQEEEYETFNLKIVHRKNRTGFEEDKNFHVVLNSVIAGRYHVTEYLGSAAFSKAIQAHDLHTGMDVCVKIIKNNKDFFDQSLDEIKLLKFVNKHDPGDKYHLLRLYDYFYYREHLLIVCELLKANLYEFHKFNRESGGEVYFTMPRLQSITIQCLEALEFLHGLGLIHCDLKPENILVKSYSRCEVKVIDLGSSCFETDHLCSYVQSRSYRAPEVLLGLPYDKKIDVWSLGCILAELCTGNVLFQNDSPATLLARVIGIISQIDQEMLVKGKDTHKYFTKNHMLYERNQDTNRLEYLIPKKTSLRHRLPMGDQGFIDFVSHLLEINPKKRPSAAQALKHPWLSYPYEPISS